MKSFSIGLWDRLTIRRFLQIAPLLSLFVLSACKPSDPGDVQSAQEGTGAGEVEPSVDTITGVWMIRHTNEQGKVVIGIDAYRKDGVVLSQVIVADRGKQTKYAEEGTWSLEGGRTIELTITNSNYRSVTEPLTSSFELISLNQSNLVYRTKEGAYRVLTRQVR